MKITMRALAIASLLLLCACSTNSVVRQSYKADAGTTYVYTLHGNADTDADSLATFRQQLDAKLKAAQLLGTAGAPGARTLDITVTHYYMRSNGARFWAGVMAGRDKMATSIAVKQGDATLAAFDVESTNATSFGSSGGLMETHAEEIVQRLLQMR
ncbi:DUF4410 domain-containing protein [Xanthomonas maliensis]|uniref:DUF4410 domain-containing protein n=1 Tax=Xanthomonas maliensis TaxID=1321368 RepID=UPI0003A7639A|nr:DUF4410 domain-containing protein [Xanthomonas maliensis]KAB7762486.1 DUF4410 domain-containing protein [Xanthomonas maliensis]